MRAVIDQDRVTEYADPETMLPRIAERSVQVIRDHAGDSQPLFLYVALSSLHTPIVPTPEWQGRSGLSEYGDFVMQTDDAVGQILAALEECELAKETLVIFTSDNGCSKAAGIEQLAEQGHAVSGPYRGSKADLWEGGHRVPFLVRWPGKVDAGTDCHQTICLTDLFATVVELVGREPPVGSCEDSVSFLPALRGETIPRQRSGIVHHSISGHFAYRHEDWKLLLARGSGGWTQPTERALRDRPPAGQLYDLSRDPGERHNQFETRPEMVQRLLGFLREDVRKGHSVGVGESANDQATIRLWKSGAPERGPPKQ
jgi:arylsulfatase A-like enzyme